MLSGVRALGPAGPCWAHCARAQAVIAALQQGSAGLSHRLSAPQARLDFAQNPGVICSHDGKGEGQRAPEIRVLLPPDGSSEGSTGSWGWSSSHLWAGSPGLARPKWTAGTPGSLPCPGNPLPAWHCLTLPIHGQGSISPSAAERLVELPGSFEELC